MDINKVIGKRLALEVGPEERERFIEKMGWQPQTYYEARSGRRVFRVSELVAMAKAIGVPAWTFLDADGITKTVSVGDGVKATTITGAALLDLFHAREPAIRSLTAAAKTIRTVIANLVGYDAPPPEGGIAHQLYLAVRLIEHDIKRGGSK